MNKHTAEMLARLSKHVTYDDALALRRIAMTLHAWSEQECNGTIQRDGENGDGKPRAYYENYRGEHVRGSLIPDRERGAQKRLAKIMGRYPCLGAYEQTDPRGAPLYIYRHIDLDSYKARVGNISADINSCYNSIGIAVYR
jgi:hypothetical protein